MSERETSICMELTTWACALTQNRISNLSVHRTALNWATLARANKMCFKFRIQMLHLILSTLEVPHLYVWGIKCASFPVWVLREQTFQCFRICDTWKKFQLIINCAPHAILAICLYWYILFSLILRRKKISSHNFIMHAYTILF